VRRTALRALRAMERAARAGARAGADGGSGAQLISSQLSRSQPISSQLSGSQPIRSGGSAGKDSGTCRAGELGGRIAGGGGGSVDKRARALLWLAALEGAYSTEEVKTRLIAITAAAAQTCSKDGLGLRSCGNGGFSMDIRASGGLLLDRIHQHSTDQSVSIDDRFSAAAEPPCSILGLSWISPGDVSATPLDSSCQLSGSQPISSQLSGSQPTSSQLSGSQPNSSQLSGSQPISSQLSGSQPIKSGGSGGEGFRTGYMRVALDWVERWPEETLARVLLEVEASVAAAVSRGTAGTLMSSHWPAAASSAHHSQSAVTGVEISAPPALPPAVPPPSQLQVQKP
jgi:hypothetical protein